MFSSPIITKGNLLLQMPLPGWIIELNKVALSNENPEDSWRRKTRFRVRMEQFLCLLVAPVCCDEFILITISAVPLQTLWVGSVTSVTLPMNESCYECVLERLTLTAPDTSGGALCATCNLRADGECAIRFIRCRALLLQHCHALSNALPLYVHTHMSLCKVHRLTVCCRQTQSDKQLLTLIHFFSPLYYICV